MPSSNGNVGYWTFQYASGGPKATYTDPDPSTINGYSYTFVANDCNGLLIDTNGTWQPATLAQLFP